MQSNKSCAPSQVFSQELFIIDLLGEEPTIATKRMPEEQLISGNL